MLSAKLNKVEFTYGGSYSKFYSTIKSTFSPDKNGTAKREAEILQWLLIIFKKSSNVEKSSIYFPLFMIILEKMRSTYNPTLSSRKKPAP